MKYKVSDLSKVLGVTTNTIRRYEKEGYLEAERDISDYRWYKSFDINKTATIRLLIKCGFSHNEIKEILNTETDKSLEVCTKRLNEIDAERERLYYLRHWLKDNIQMMKNVDIIGDGYVIKDCPAIKYILYSKGDELFKESDRLKIINEFMYTIPEVQLIQIFKYEDLKENKFVAYSGWAIKEVDIKRLKVKELVINSQYLESYPPFKCLCGTLSIPAKYITDTDYVIKVRTEFFTRTYAYMEEHNMEIIDNVMEFFVNVISDTVRVIVSIPFDTI